MTELVQTFNFWVRLTRTPVAGATLQPPPDRGFPAAKGQLVTREAQPPGRRRAPPIVTAPPPSTAGQAGLPETLGDGGFQECSGLELDADLVDLLEGGRNDGIIRRLGRAKLTPIVLKRGMLVPEPAGQQGGFADTALWDWLQHMVRGDLPVARYDGHVEVLEPRISTEQDPRPQRVLAQWSFDRGLPSKVTGPTLNAKTGEVAIEELHILHEGLRLEARTQ
jgi:phage tail-like protein